MYANVILVKINDFETGKKELETEILPRVRSMPGFQRGFWTASDDRKSGSALVVFDTKENAEAAAKMVPPSEEGDPVVREWVNTVEVIADA